MNDVTAPRDPIARILEAAGSVFFTAGFERTSVDMIAASARMSKQSIYESFPSKLALFEATVRSTLDQAWLNMTAVDDTQDVETTLTRYGLRVFEGYFSSISFGMFRANIAAARHFPELASELHTQRLRTSQPLADYLEKLRSIGQIGSIDPQAMAIRFGGLVVEGSRYFLGAPKPDANARATIAARAVHLFLNGYQNMPVEAAPPHETPPIHAPELAGTATLRLSPDKLLALVNAAEKEFQSQGYHRASLDRVAAAAHVSKATIYRQFGNKEKLLRYIVQRHIFETYNQPITIDNRPADLESALALFARQMLDLNLSPCSIEMHRLIIEEIELVGDLARNFHDLRAQKVGDALSTLLQQFNAPPASDAARLAFYLLSTFAVRFVTSTQLPSSELRRRYSQETAQLFLYGIRNARG